MPEIGSVNGGGVPAQNQAAEKSVAPVNQSNAQIGQQPIGQPGPLGQPTGLPAPIAPGQAGVLPDVLAGRDPSQLVAAERMRAAGGASATDELLGLNRQPTILGAFPPPPGNSEALRHMTPTMRRSIMRVLLDRQRERLRRLTQLLRQERDGDGGREERRDEPAAEPRRDGPALESAYTERAHGELISTTRMLDLLDELLAMQDYAISQMGTFSQG